MGKTDAATLKAYGIWYGGEVDADRIARVQGSKATYDAAVEAARAAIIKGLRAQAPSRPDPLDADALYYDPPVDESGMDYPLIVKSVLYAYGLTPSVSS